MKKVLIIAVALICLIACAQKKMGKTGRDMELNKDSDSTFVALKNETLGKFKQLTYEDKETGKRMEYNLFVPEGYDGTASYPLVLFIADASTVRKDVTPGTLVGSNPAKLIKRL